MKAEGHVVEIDCDKVTIDGLVVPVVGTYDVGNGVSITGQASRVYLVTYLLATLVQCVLLDTTWILQ